MQLRYYQDEAVDAIPAYYTNGGTGNVLIAMPTGTGKSLVIGEAIKRFYQQWPGQRFACLTHVKELIGQNAATLERIWPQAPYGINSAGLGSRDYESPIVFGGIGSVASNIAKLGHRDLCFVDEAHLIGPNSETLYQRTFDGMLKINPNMKVVGLTATPYRLKHGLLTEAGLFTKTIYDITGMEAFNRLLAEGYLAPLYPKETKLHIDVSSVAIRGGDFANDQLEAIVDTDEVTDAAVREAIAMGQDKHSWMCFCASIHHAEHVASVMRQYGIAAVAVHSKMTGEERDAVIADFKAGRIRCIVNKDVLTTGFDHPPIDFIIMLRHTVSPGKWVQMLGRGTRPYDWQTERDPMTRIAFPYKKEYCLVADFAANTRRLGPINDPRIPTKGKKRGGEAPVKTCLAPIGEGLCMVHNHCSARFCISCNAEFVFEEKVTDEASSLELIRWEGQTLETYKVDMVLYSLRQKPGKPPYMLVKYMCGRKAFTECVFLDNPNFQASRARKWWETRSPGAYGYISSLPSSDWQYSRTEHMLQYTSALAQPKQITVDTNKEFPDITNYEW